MIVTKSRIYPDAAHVPNVAIPTEGPLRVSSMLIHLSDGRVLSVIVWEMLESGGTLAVVEQ